MKHETAPIAAGETQKPGAIGESIAEVTGLFELTITKTVA